MKETTLKNLRESFEKIPVPDDLEGKVRASIEQAKWASEMENGKHKESQWSMKARNIIKGTGAVAAAFLLGVTALANSGASIASAMGEIPVLGAITRVVTFRSYDNIDGGASAHIEIPSVEGGDQVNKAIQDYTDTIIEQYKKDASEIGDEGHYNLDLTYETVTDNDRIFALRFNQTLVMASGSESVKIYDVDKETGKILTLSDLFKADSNYLDILTQNIQSQMKEQMEKDENVSYWLDSDVGDWNFTALSPDAAFYINQDGNLVIVFNEGDVAPMYMGVCEFTIPSDVVKDISNPDYLQ